jgi:uncharacterized membrane protein
MMTKLSSSEIAGQKANPMLTAVSSAVCSYLLSAAVVQSINQVLGPGAGTYTGKIVGCIPTTMSSLMMTKTTSAKLVGKDTRRFFDAISFGICQSLMTTALAQGVVIGGGPGVGQGKITALVPSTLQNMIFSSLPGKKLQGSKINPFLSAIAFGICNHIMSAAVVQTICIGAVGIPPILIPAAAGPGKIV